MPFPLGHCKVHDLHEAVRVRAAKPEQAPVSHRCLDFGSRRLCCSFWVLAKRALTYFSGLFWTTASVSGIEKGMVSEGALEPTVCILIHPGSS